MTLPTDDATRGRGGPGREAQAKDDAATIPQTNARAQWRVEIVDPTNRRAKPWAPPYPTRDDAERIAASLRAVKMFAQVRRVDDEPEYRESRRAFLIAMFAIDAVKRKQLVDRIVAELEAEAST